MGEHNTQVTEKRNKSQNASSAKRAGKRALFYAQLPSEWAPSPIVSFPQGPRADGEGPSLLLLHLVLLPLPRQEKKREKGACNQPMGTALPERLMRGATKGLGLKA